MSGTFYARCEDCGRRFDFYFPNKGEPAPSNHPRRCRHCSRLRKRARADASGQTARREVRRRFQASDARGETDQLMREVPKP